MPTAATRHIESTLESVVDRRFDAPIVEVLPALQYLTPYVSLLAHSRSRWQGKVGLHNEY